MSLCFISAPLGNWEKICLSRATRLGTKPHERKLVKKVSAMHTNKQLIKNAKQTGCVSDELFFRLLNDLLKNNQRQVVLKILDRDPNALLVYNMLLRLKKVAKLSPKKMRAFEKKSFFTPPHFLLKKLKLANKRKKTRRRLFLQWLHKFEPPG